ncbi:hypothetical protein BDV93DRAFT_548664 [Ceratobasidium sp. AG-I]|nr:hypothetical protein BDV93DRAFT_548664 [Ceratobasidium sp. AG-I]
MAQQYRPYNNEHERQSGPYSRLRKTIQFATDAAVDAYKAANLFLIRNPLAAVVLILLALFMFMPKADVAPKAPLVTGTKECEKQETMMNITGCIHGTGNMCTPYWMGFKDERCTREGRKRVYSYLQGLSVTGDQSAICESTPAIINGDYYAMPTYCQDGALGVYGIFDIPDKGCAKSAVKKQQ